MAKKQVVPSHLNDAPPARGAFDKAFLGKLLKTMGGIEGVSLDSSPPRYWFSTRNAALNKIISNTYTNGIPQGRVTGVAGPSGSGKSFIASNCMVGAQEQAAFVLAIDTENALDDSFVQAVGVNTKENYVYTSASTIPQVSQIVSEFVKEYKKDYGTSHDAPKVLIVIDSLDMLMTESELANYNAGDPKADQGQKAKQLKAMLRTFVQDIKEMNISIIVTTQVYQATQQQIMAGEGVWVINAAVRYALSQLILCTRLKLKDKDTKIVSGIRMKCEAFKTRFAKPFQNVTIEVPYETGIEYYNGIHDMLKASGLLEQKGSWYTLSGTEIKYQEKNFSDVGEQILGIVSQREAEGLELKLDVGTGEELVADPDV